MPAARLPTLEEARERAASIPIDEIDISHWDHFESDTIAPYFERLRRDAPVHYCRGSRYGPYWSITRFEDVRAVNLDHERFSSEPSITILDQAEDFRTPMFIAMDPPKHDEQRKVVRPAVAPANVRKLEPLIRQRAAAILDSLPIGEEFDWVSRVSIELTTQMLATLFDFPMEERHRLTRWSDVASGGPHTGVVESMEERRRELRECLETFRQLFVERRAQAPTSDLLSMLAHAPATRDMDERPMELLGNVALLIVGGNDTTRNSISGGVLALNRQPEQYQKLRDDPGLIPNMVSEIIRWQTPLAHMRRTATQDVEVGGEKLRRGDKVIMWYVSANRDEEVFPDGDSLQIDRANAHQHLAFGFGVHRCMGAHLAEAQLEILWQEILARFHTVEVVGEPERIRSNFIRGYKSLPVRLHSR